jgi:hypothetical protein
MKSQALLSCSALTYLVYLWTSWMKPSQNTRHPIICDFLFYPDAVQYQICIHSELIVLIQVASLFIIYVLFPRDKS